MFIYLYLIKSLNLRFNYESIFKPEDKPSFEWKIGLILIQAWIRIFCLNLRENWNPCHLFIVLSFQNIIQLKILHLCTKLYQIVLNCTKLYQIVPNKVSFEKSFFFQPDSFFPSSSIFIYTISFIKPVSFLSNLFPFYQTCFLYNKPVYFLSNLFSV